MSKKNQNVLAPVIPGENLRVYKRQEKELLHYFKPTDGAEEGLVRDIARYRWLVCRAIRLQEEYVVRTQWVMGRDFNVLLRYQTQNDSSARRLIKLLQTFRKNAALAKIGFVSQKAEEPLTHSKIHPEIADRWENNTAVLDPKTNTFILLRVLRDREREENERRPT